MNIDNIGATALILILLAVLILPVLAAQQMRDGRRLIIFTVLMTIIQVAGIYLFLKDGNDAISRFVLWMAFGVSWVAGAIFRTSVLLFRHRDKGPKNLKEGGAPIVLPTSRH
jgi:hypothetical protein